jgi:Papain family cysteine protease
MFRFVSFCLCFIVSVDCDTSGDQGCTGGNPLLSFYFIHRYGLTTWDKYPYVGHQDECREHLIKQPVATVKSWGIISPNHEAHMELVLRHIGPIAAGVNGASPSFLAYEGGVYDNPYCRQGANHALLITGYGEEVVQGKTVRFWCARNSWGTGWGEGGYVRIKRNDGVKGSTGVCGIARSPSVALGGVLLPLRGEVIEDDAMSSLLATHGPMERLCFRLGLGFNGTCLATTTWLDDHKVLLLAMFGVGLFLASIYLLTYDIRRRRRRRTERRRRLSASSRDEESSALLPSPSSSSSSGNGHNGYGSAAAH